MRQMQLPLTLAGAAVLVLSAPASAQCTTVDFEDLPVGTVVCDQYDGVEIYAWPGSCGGFGSVLPHIVEPLQGTSSGTQALGIQTGCPDFSPDFLWLVFDEPQRAVSFTVGEQASTGLSFIISVYDSDQEAIPPYPQTVVTGAGVYHLVEIGSPEGPAQIKHVLIENPYDYFETIDDLSFGADSTPPDARIDSPVHSDCLCDGYVTVSGIACDFDSAYGMDKLEYRAVGAAPGEPWTLIGTYSSPVCDPGPLYNWNVNGVSHGWYFLRLTVENACGLASTDIVSVLVDKQFGTVQVTSPSNNQDICGIVEFFGTVNDHCGHCFDHYTVEYALSPNGPYYPVDPAQPTYDEIVINGRIATWNTVGNGVPDGDYYVRILGIDDCENVEIVELFPHLDNSQPCGCPADVDEDGDVDTADLLALLAAWGACP
jgi:hypothetical protein